MTAVPVTTKKGPFEWHTQQMFLLKKWGEIASCYRWMHNQSYMKYKKKNLYFMIPLIIMSTVTGTANFAQSSFPESIRPNVPQIIGSINLISAIMTTIYQFLKISEYMESHRISSINYGKLARNITTELNIPVKDRDSSGADCVKLTRLEIDRLIEQSPSIPKEVLRDFDRKFSGEDGLEKPEIVVIKKIDIYEDPENKIANTVADASLKFKQLVKKPILFSKISKAISKAPPGGPPGGPPVAAVQSSPMKKFLNIFNKEQVTYKNPVNPFNQVLEQMKSQQVLMEQVQSVDVPTHPVIQELPSEIIVQIPDETEEPQQLDIIEGENISVSDEIEILRNSKLVSSKKE
jgi:hypothetical protein